MSCTSYAKYAAERSVNIAIMSRKRRRSRFHRATSREAILRIGGSQLAFSFSREETRETRVKQRIDTRARRRSALGRTKCLIEVPDVAASA